VAEQLGERVLADVPLADRLVPVAGRAERVLRVVGVHQPEAAAADGLDQASSVFFIPPGLETSWPAAKAWQVSRQTPSSSWWSSWSNHGSSACTVAASACPPPAVGSTSSRGPSGSAASSTGQQRRPQLRHRLVAVARRDRAARVDDDAARADRPARRSACSTAAVDRLRVTSVGLPKFTR
jgi:hypothetical protein